MTSRWSHLSDRIGWSRVHVGSCSATLSLSLGVDRLIDCLIDCSTAAVVLPSTSPIVLLPLLPPHLHALSLPLVACCRSRVRGPDITNRTAMNSQSVTSSSRRRSAQPLQNTHTRYCTLTTPRLLSTLGCDEGANLRRRHHGRETRDALHEALGRDRRLQLVERVVGRRNVQRVHLLEELHGV